MDGADRLLLFRGHDPHRPDAPAFWFPPGGGLHEGESLRQAARRELREETGLSVAELHGPIWRRTVLFQHESVRYRQEEWYYLARTEEAAIDTSAFDEVEARAITDHRWWTARELAGTQDVVYPAVLAELLPDVLAGRLPEEPVELPEAEE